LSTLRIDNFGPSAGGTTYSARGIAKAWVNFNGTGTIAARDSENVSSLTDNGTGVYTTNVTSSFNDTNFCHMAVSGELTVSWGIVQLGILTTSSARFGIFDPAASALDSGNNGVSMHGDLA
jgi:hypothetical protein